MVSISRAAPDASRIRRVALIISGPMPSPWATVMGIFIITGIPKIVTPLPGGISEAALFSSKPANPLWWVLESDRNGPPNEERSTQSESGQGDCNAQSGKQDSPRLHRRQDSPTQCTDSQRGMGETAAGWLL